MSEEPARFAQFFDGEKAAFPVFFPVDSMVTAELRTGAADGSSAWNRHGHLAIWPSYRVPIDLHLTGHF